MRNGMSRLIGECRNPVRCTSMWRKTSICLFQALHAIPRDGVSAIIYIRRSQLAFERVLQPRQSKWSQWPYFSLLHPQVVCFVSSHFLSFSCYFAHRRPAGTFTHIRLSKNSTQQTPSLSRGSCGGSLRRVRNPFRRSGFRAGNDAAWSSISRFPVRRAPGPTHVV